MTAKRHGIGHVPGLDGLRGLAVLGVLFFHANARLRGGFLGVDLFFVLSGFLITSILLAEHERTGRIDLGTFWVRRARRLLPALLSLVPAVALYARTLAPASEVARIRGDALATLAYVANWRAILSKRSYWEMFAEPSPLEHTWSLAIEEQFYVVWPLVVALVLRLGRGRPRALAAVSLALALASAAAMAALHARGGTMRVYLGTDTRGAAILVGAALAASGLVRPGRTAPAALDAVGLAALGGLGWAWWTFEGQSDLLYRGGFWATELAALVLVACAVLRPEGWVGRALSLAPLRWVGTISYGVYLWHWPIYVVLSEERLHLGGAPLLALRLAVTFAVAYASYRGFERPIRERGLPWGRPWLVVPGAFAAALAAILVGTVGRAPPPVAAAPNASPPPPPPPAADARAPKTFPPMKTFPPASELYPDTLRVLVLGDSVALSLGNRMYWSHAAEDAVVVQRAIGDCSILDGVVPVRSMGGEPHGNGNCARGWVEDVRELGPDVTLVLLGGAYFSRVKAEGSFQDVCHRGWRDPFVKRLSELLVAMKPHAGALVVALTAYPVGRWQTPTLNDKVDCFNRMLRDAAGAAGADVLDLAAHVCPDRVCTTTSLGEPVRPDGLHFDGLGAEETARWTLRELRARAARDRAR